MSITSNLVAAAKFKHRSFTGTANHRVTVTAKFKRHNLAALPILGYGNRQTQTPQFYWHSCIIATVYMPNTTIC